MTTRKRDPGSGLTPLDGTELVYAETGQPIPHEPAPKRRRTKSSAAEAPPAYANLQALADEIERASALDAAEQIAAGIKARELRAERTALDAELREVKQLVKQFKRLFPTELVPTSLIARFNRVRDGIVANEGEMFEVRHILAGDVGLEHADLAREKQQAQAERERHARAVKQAKVLEAARRQGRREYAALHRVLGHDRPPSSASDPVVASSAPAELIACTALNCVDHEDHWASQRVRLPDGSTGQIFTGV